MNINDIWKKAIRIDIENRNRNCLLRQSASNMTDHSLIRLKI